MLSAKKEMEQVLVLAYLNILGTLIQVADLNVLLIRIVTEAEHV
jgi:hypothetical protein